MSKEFTPLPPFTTHAIRRLTHLQAHTFLSAFLTTAENDPSYRPDSTLTDRGPISVSTSGSSSLTLGNLKRILKGLEGKRVGGAHLKGVFGAGDAQGGDGRGSGRKRGRDEGVLEEDGDGDEGVKRRRMHEVGDGVEVDVEDDEPVLHTDDNKAKEAEGGADWQDQAEFELEQDDENVDVMNEERDPGANLEQPVNEREEQEMVEVKVANTGKKVDSRRDEGSGGVDEEEETKKRKDKRKEDKKARMKAEKAQRAEEQRKKKKKKQKDR